MSHKLIIIIIGVYIIMSFITLIILHLFHEKLGVPDYDNRIQAYSDDEDWENNTDAYLVFSITWPFIWSIIIIQNLYKMLTYLSEIIQNSINGSKEI